MATGDPDSISEHFSDTQGVEFQDPLGERSSETARLDRGFCAPWLIAGGAWSHMARIIVDGANRRCRTSQ
jgi:hypothetical protein